jgi:hypothetical protein
MCTTGFTMLLHIQVDPHEPTDDDDFQIEQELPAGSCSQVKGILQKDDIDEGMKENQDNITDQDGNEVQRPQVPTSLGPLAEAAKGKNIEELADALQGTNTQVRNSQV